jgi:hypothetical protein
MTTTRLALAVLICVPVFLLVAAGCVGMWVWLVVTEVDETKRGA